MQVIPNMQDDTRAEENRTTGISKHKQEGKILLPPFRFSRLVK